MSTRFPLPLGERPILIGVVHLLPLPGAPLYGGALEGVIEAALRDARALAEGGSDALLVENFGDTPFLPGRVAPETVAAMALVLAEVRRALPTPMPVGVNVLRNDARSALGLCVATGASFLRVNVHAGAAVTDQGLIEGRADQTLRMRAALGSAAAILADVQVKHASPLGASDLAEAARELVERALADALLVTGAATGTPPDPERVACVREAIGPRVPLLVASGVDEDNAAELCSAADGAIVGTALKEGGDVHAPVDPERVRALRRALG